VVYCQIAGCTIQKAARMIDNGYSGGIRQNQIAFLNNILRRFRAFNHPQQIADQFLVV
jgi:hypothetical protein